MLCTLHSSPRVYQRPLENVTNAADVWPFLLIDMVTDRDIAWLNVTRIFRGAIIHIMDNVNLLNLKENLELTGSSLFMLF